MGIKSQKLKLYEKEDSLDFNPLKIDCTYIKIFTEKYILKDKTMNESDLQRVYSYPIYPRLSKLFSDNGFRKTDNGSTAGFHWTAVCVKNNEDSMSHANSAQNSFYIDSFGRPRDKFPFNQIPKPKIYQYH